MAYNEGGFGRSGSSRSGGFRRSGSGGFRREGGFRRDFGPREMHKITCSECGNPGEVPFKPRQGTPVYCKDCFAKRSGRTPRSEHQGSETGGESSEGSEEM